MKRVHPNKKKTAAREKAEAARQNHQISMQMGAAAAPAAAESPGQLSTWSWSPTRPRNKGQQSGVSPGKSPTRRSLVKGTELVTAGVGLADVRSHYQRSHSGRDLFAKDRSKDYREAARLRLLYTKGSRFLIDPRRSRYMPVWDVLMMCALVYTATVTPYEVTFVDEGACVTPLFIVNRLVDVLFFADILIIFNLSYQSTSTGVWVTDRRQIGRKYLLGFFIIDLVSILPFYIAPFILAQMEGEQVNCSLGGQLNVENVANNPLMRASQSTKLIKLLRMLKLARVFKASRVLKRFVQDILMTKLELTFALIKVGSLSFALLLIAHWQACIFALVPAFMGPGERSWVQQFVLEQSEAGVEVYPLDLYIASLYWSIMTLTSIGYGDIVPVHSFERALSCFYMIVSAGTWTYVIGTAAGIAATLDPNAVVYHTTMDRLNMFMRERELPREMRLTLRSFFESAREVHQVESDSDLLFKMTPLLQGTVAWRANKPWLDRIWFLRDQHSTREGREFIAALAMKMQLQAYISHERLPIGQLYVLRKGMVVKLWRFLGPESVFGEDMLLGDPNLICHSQAVALTYVETFSLSKDSFEDVAVDHPAPMVEVEKQMRKIRLQRALLRYMADRQGREGARSFVSRDVARGYSYVTEATPLEKQLRELREEVMTRVEGQPVPKRFELRRGSEARASPSGWRSAHGAAAKVSAIVHQVASKQGAPSAGPAASPPTQTLEESQQAPFKQSSPSVDSMASIQAQLADVQQQQRGMGERMQAMAETLEKIHAAILQPHPGRSQGGLVA
jgi:CRP-like cAMP-binding protein